MVSFGVEDFVKRFGALKPSQFVDVVALSGDKADNIPGIFCTVVPFDAILARVNKAIPSSYSIITQPNCIGVS
jgi:5'-3' exonuclease